MNFGPDRLDEWRDFADAAAIDGVLTLDLSEYVDLMAANGIMEFRAPWWPVIFANKRVEVVE